MRKIPFLVLFILCSCTKPLIDYSIPEERNILEISGTISQEYLTKVNDCGFANGDRMGVYIVNYKENAPGQISASQNHATNVSLVYNENTYKWTSSNPIYWKDKETHVDVYGYYPYESVIQSVNDYEFSVLADQSQKAIETGMSNYEQSDFLWAKVTDASPADGTIFLNFSHRMAGIKVSLLKGSGFSQDEWETTTKTVSVDGLVRKASIDIATGIVEANGAHDKNIVMASQSEDVFRAVVVPQTAPSGMHLIGITIDGTSYHYTISEDISFISGKMYSFSLQIDKRVGGDYVVTLISQEISTWENDNISHAFETTAYTVIHCEHEGALAESVASIGKNPATIQNLKITGRLNSVDFEFIRNSMTVLKGLNLSDAIVMGYVNIDYKIYHSSDILQKKIPSLVYNEYENILPEGALADKKSLKHLVLPKNLIALGWESLKNLELAHNSTLVIPNTVLVLGYGAMQGMTECSVILPNSLVVIDNWAMADQTIRYEINIPKSVLYIGDSAFKSSRNAYGKLSLPSGLLYLGSWVFDSFGSNIEASIVVPPAITSLESFVFSNSLVVNGQIFYDGGGFKKFEITFHDNITSIGYGAFNGCRFNNTVVWPKNLKRIETDAFSHCSFDAGMQNLPEGLISVGSSAFSGATLPNTIQFPSSINQLPGSVCSQSNISSIDLPPYLESIGSTAFFWCQDLEYVKIGKYVEEIEGGAFAYCPGLRTVVCLNPEPPKMQNSFYECDFDHLILEVPEHSVEKYRNATGWREFKYITAHHELALSVKDIQCLDKEAHRTIVVRSEGPWEVINCPSWCHPSQMSSDINTTEVNLTIDSANEAREGNLVFKLKDKDYTSECSVRQFMASEQEDKEIILQEASSGYKPIPVFIVGDGFTAEMIADGSYLQRCNEQMEAFFSIEPYKTYRDFFTVSTSLAASPEKGITNVAYNVATRFNSIDDPSVGLRCNYEELNDYVVDVATGIDNSNVSDALIMLIMNQSSFSGSVYICDNGTTIAMNTLSPQDYPLDTRGLVQHYAGGSGFGRLASEEIQQLDFIDNLLSRVIREGQAKGWYNNISTSGSVQSVPWKHLIFDPRYSDIVDVFEGGFGFMRGVYRSEVSDCMSDYTQYYSTYSRELIVRRIMEISGKGFDFESFVENDSREGKLQ